jgi:hypothetical protein
MKCVSTAWCLYTRTMHSSQVPYIRGQRIWTSSIFSRPKTILGVLDLVRLKHFRNLMGFNSLPKVSAQWFWLQFITILIFQRIERASNSLYFPMGSGIRVSIIQVCWNTLHASLLYTCTRCLALFFTANIRFDKIIAPIIFHRRVMRAHDWSNYNFSYECVSAITSHNIIAQYSFLWAPAYENQLTSPIASKVT